MIGTHVFATSTLDLRRIGFLGSCALFMLIEGFDLSAMPLAVPRVAAQWDVPPASFAFSLSAVIVGIGLSAILIAPLGERFGRRQLILSSGLFTCAVTFGTATAGSPLAFAIWRLLTGLGLGACLPNVTACAAAIAPKHIKARALALISVAIPIGSVIAGFLVGPMVALAGWQGIFIAAGALTAIATLVLFLLLGKVANATPPPSASVARFQSASSPKPPLREIFGAPYKKTTILLIALGSTNAFLLYMLANWLPTLLPRAGMTMDMAARLSAIMQAGGIAGGLLIAQGMDKGRSYPAFNIGYVSAIGALLGLAMLRYSPSFWMPLLIILGGGITGAHTAILIFGMSFFPDRLTSSFVGAFLALTRFGAILGPLFGAAVLDRTVGIAPFMIAAMLPILLCLGMLLAIRQQARRTATVFGTATLHTEKIDTST
ncbi:MAG: MFS transporter [Sphingomonas sp.]|nr:MFS transporter [Sphingomonas sp.]